MKKTYRYFEHFEALGFTIKEALKMQKLVDETYYNLCSLWLYGDTYTKLQNIHAILDCLLSDEYVDEDDLAEVYCFYQNHYKN